MTIVCYIYLCKKLHQFLCVQCEKSFSQDGDPKKHVQSDHEKLKPFSHHKSFDKLIHWSATACRACQHNTISPYNTRSFFGSNIKRHFHENLACNHICVYNERKVLIKKETLKETCFVGKGCRFSWTCLFILPPKNDSQHIEIVLSWQALQAVADQYMSLSKELWW